jgi:hypothetical protein
MSSMLLKPTPEPPRHLMAPNRLETFWIGWPSVFHTAPPQPASNARITCSPEFVGGAEASQKGFGDTMPPQFAVRSGISDLPRKATHGWSGRRRDRPRRR